jgi:CheY-like chemotaxis protein
MPKPPLVAAGSHAVQFYEGERWLHAALVRFFDTAWRSGASAVMIARQTTFDAMVARPSGTGRIHFLDADAAVDQIMNGDALDRGRAEAALRGLVEQFGGPSAPRLCIYGEIVDVLCRQGRHDAAIDFETLWNEMAIPDVSVMCGYHLENFTADVHGDRFRAVSRAHTHVIPAVPLAVPIVYVVDDDASMRRSLARLIGSIDVAVRTFASAEEFFNEVDRNSPGCLLLDMHLPGINGIDLQTLMAAEGWRMPTVMMSGLDDKRTEAAMRRLGARACLRKPFDASVLFEALALVED